MDLADDMHVITVDSYHSYLSEDVLDFVGFCCRFVVDFFTSYCLRINIKHFHIIKKFSFVDKL